MTALRAQVRRAVRRSNAKAVAGAAQFDYHLDSSVAVSGDGRSRGAAFKTVSDLEAAVTPYAGMTVGVARGSSFREEIDWSPDGTAACA